MSSLLVCPCILSRIPKAREGWTIHGWKNVTRTSFFIAQSRDFAELHEWERRKTKFRPTATVFMDTYHLFKHKDITFSPWKRILSLSLSLKHLNNTDLFQRTRLSILLTYERVCSSYLAEIKSVAVPHWLDCGNFNNLLESKLEGNKSISTD